MNNLDNLSQKDRESIDQDPGQYEGIPDVLTDEQIKEIEKEREREAEKNSEEGYKYLLDETTVVEKPVDSPKISSSARETKVEVPRNKKTKVVYYEPGMEAPDRKAAKKKKAEDFELKTVYDKEARPDATKEEIESFDEGLGEMLSREKLSEFRNLINEELEKEDITSHEKYQNISLILRSAGVPYEKLTGRDLQQDIIERYQQEVIDRNKPESERKLKIYKGKKGKKEFINEKKEIIRQEIIDGQHANILQSRFDSLTQSEQEKYINEETRVPDIKIFKERLDEIFQLKVDRGILESIDACYILMEEGYSPETAKEIGGFLGMGKKISVNSYKEGGPQLVMSVKEFKRQEEMQQVEVDRQRQVLIKNELQKRVQSAINVIREIKTRKGKEILDEAVGPVVLESEKTIDKDEVIDTLDGSWEQRVSKDGTIEFIKKGSGLSEKKITQEALRPEAEDIGKSELEILKEKEENGSITPIELNEKLLPLELDDFEKNIPPIGVESFDFKEEFKKNKKPRMGKAGKEKVEMLKDKLLRQQQAIALCQSFIEREIEMNPDIPEGGFSEWKGGLMTWVNKIGDKYGFTQEQKEIASKVIDKYKDQQEKAKNLVSKDKQEVIELLGGKTIDGLGLTQEDLKKVTVSVNGATVYVEAEAGVVSKLFSEGAIASTSRMTGFQKTSNGIMFVVVSNESVTPKEVTQQHEQRHATHALLGETFRKLNVDTEKDIYVAQAEDTDRDKELKAEKLRDYLEAVQKWGLGKAKDEIIAILDGRTELGKEVRAVEVLKKKWKDTFLNPEKDYYDFFKDIKQSPECKNNPDLTKAIFEVGYGKILKGAIDAFSAVVEMKKEEGLSTREAIKNAIYLFTYVDLEFWQAHARRLENHKENILNEVSLANKERGGEGESGEPKDLNELVERLQEFVEPNNKEEFDKSKTALLNLVNALLESTNRQRDIEVLADIKNKEMKQMPPKLRKVVSKLLKVVVGKLSRGEPMEIIKW